MKSIKMLNRKKILPYSAILLLLAVIIWLPVDVNAGLERLSGKILLQVEENGEAWYVNPPDQKRYYLGRPTDAFNIMKYLGLGATHDFISSHVQFPFRVSGRILLDVESHGEAYYINPEDLKAYYLGRPADAFELMKKFGLGITNSNLAQIPVGQLEISPDPAVCAPCYLKNPDNVLQGAADSIRKGDIDSALNYFTPDMREAVRYGLENLDSEGLYDLAAIISSAQKKSESENEMVYSTPVYFALGDSEVDSKLTLKKQADGTWLLYGL